MRKRVSGLLSVAVVLGLALPAGAGAATTLGTTTQPAGSSPIGCGSGSVQGQFTSDPTTPYMVPPGGGLITSWSINTTGDTPGLPVTFLVLRPNGGDTFTIVGTDSETIPNPLPSGNVATYTLSAPISVTEGDTLGLWTNAGNEVTCYWDGGSTPTGDTLMDLESSTTPTTGQVLAITGGTSPAGFTLNLLATLGPNVQDAGVTTSAAPADDVAGYPELLSSTVRNGGPGTSPITFIEHVPSGFTIDSVATGSGTCSTSGQFVICAITGLAPGKSGLVNILATPTSSGTYTNSVAVLASSGSDPNRANDNASAALHVRSTSAAPNCVVPRLKGTPVGVAKHLLHMLGCDVGKVSHRHSKSVPRGNVIGTSPRAGTYARGKVVRIQVSSGRKKTKKGA
jgi:Domain of unknown function DUF11/PASTA domain